MTAAETMSETKSSAPLPCGGKTQQDLADRLWVPPGAEVTVGRYRLRSGMLYVGAGLPGAGSWSDVEPALIDPSLKIRFDQPDHGGRLLPQFPSYSWIEPANRAAYLEWLARGRKDPSAGIGYVFLFFYGIERRVLVDASGSAAARAETGTLLAEVERLLGIYGGNHSFRKYAESFLAVVRLREGNLRTEGLLPLGDPPPEPLPLRIVLGRFAAAGRPIPPDWALAWALSSPEVRQRSPYKKCLPELRELFALRYREALPPDGLLLEPRAGLAVSYQPANPGFHVAVDISVGDLPDASFVQGHVWDLQKILDRVNGELAGYSQWIGRTGDRTSAAALACLPKELARSCESEAAHRVAGWIEETLAGGASAAVPFRDLFVRWAGRIPEKIDRRDIEALTAFLAKHGYGLEPDVPWRGVSREGHIVLFRLPAGDGGAFRPLSPAWHAAAALLHLAVTVSVVDGEITELEERHLARHLEQALHLGAAERVRLEAHLRWLLADPPGQTGLKKKIELLEESQRYAIGQFLITVAGADGHVGPEELKLLTRIYSLLGLDPQAVYSDVHVLAAADVPPAEPVTVRPASPAPGGFAIPREPGPPSGVLLDPQKIQGKLAETERVATLLEKVFAADEEAAPAAAPAGGSRAGLDAAHSALLRQLAAKTAWERREIEPLAARLGLLPESALEILNEAAYARCDAPLLEGDERIDIDPEILEELLA